MKSLLLATLMLSSCMALSAREYLYDVGPFDQLSVLGNINVIYKSVPDSVGKALYDSNTDFSSALEISNNNGKLQIKEISEHNLGNLPTLHVYSAYLSNVKNEGKGTSEIFLSNPTPTFSARLVGNGRIICDGVNSTNVKATLATGNGSVIVRGKCTEAKYELMGTGLIQADGLTAKSVKCTSIGTGSIGCNATETLDVRGIGTTKIYYLGEPKIKKTGGASLHPIVSEETAQPDLVDGMEPDDRFEEVTEVVADPSETIVETQVSETSTGSKAIIEETVVTVSSTENSEGTETTEEVLPD